MSYSERFKNFSRIREYMREFYVYGFKSRDEYTKKSARSYDDEKRRMESLLGGWMRFRRTTEGKNVFLSIDSRLSSHNPLYQAWKAKSFTDGDITLHFHLMDLLADGEGLTVAELTDRVSRRLPAERCFDESTVRKKLREYEAEGLVRSEKQGKSMKYYSCGTADLTDCADALDFFSEVAPCGVIGSYLLDGIGPHEEAFRFKHHYITGALDAEVLYTLFDAMGKKYSVKLESVNRKKDRITERSVVPLRVMISAQSGRQYLMAFFPSSRRITSFRLDQIVSVSLSEPCERFDALREALDRILAHTWGISTQGRSGSRLEHVEFTVRFAENEPYIPARLEREKRCGTVERTGPDTCRYSADVYDAWEMIPWIRTFLCRITELHFSNAATEKQFWDDVRAVYTLYGVGGEEKEDEGTV